MTTKEAADLLSMIEVNDGELNTHTHWGGFDEDMKEALLMAMRSLENEQKLKEVIRKIKAEIESKAYPDYTGHNEYEMAVSDGYSNALSIIDKHLKEVENG